MERNERIVCEDVGVNLELADFIDRLYPEDGDDKTRIEEMWEEFKQVAKPRLVLKIAYVDEVSDDGVTINGIFFKSGLLAENLKYSHMVFAYVGSCSAEAEEWSHKYTNDPIESYWANIMKEVTIGPLIMYLDNKIKSDYGLQKIGVMNPGSLEDWPISEQPKLFELIGGTDDIGVRLEPSFLMIPTKSVSGIYFSTDKDWINCRMCPRKVCQNRRVPFEGV